MSTALYRRYRPDKFSDVVGQEHVTGPLRQALRADRINHAYLFSGPRGCGKTTSARILARTLNCAARLTATPGNMPDEPCGTCPSCVDLAAGGNGSLDVIEIDAASHNGVDDARELRERAVFAPVRDKYKVFVIDEAHMVTPAGFNALLKIVEEPPEHVRFVFATTEPEKVIGTIRSRTHHYPFRLIGSDTLTTHLQNLCAAEGVQVGPGVLPLVVRAGAGSARDAMSVLDQLMAGSPDGQLTQERAVSLLGFTPGSLLDDTVMALGQHDGAAAFQVLERVIGTGHDPRRFVEDLLERFRDLIIVRATGDGAAAVLREVPSDQLARLQEQAAGLGPHELSRGADVINAALTQMVGATTPRLHLELLLARLLLPAADGDGGFGARLDRLEQQPKSAGAPVLAAPTARPTPNPPTAPAAAPEQPTPPAPAATALAASPVQPSSAMPPASVTPAAAPPAAPPAAAAPPAPTPAATPHPAPTGAGLVSTLQQRWDQVLEVARQRRRTTWSVLQHAHVVSADRGTVMLGFSNDGALRMFASRSSHAELTATVIQELTGEKVQVKAQSGGGSGGTPASAPAPPAPNLQAPPSAEPTPTATPMAPPPAAQPATAPPPATPPPATPPGAVAPARQPANNPNGGWSPQNSPPPNRPVGTSAAHSGGIAPPTAPASPPPAAPTSPPPAAPQPSAPSPGEDAEPSLDDIDDPSDGGGQVSGAAALVDVLGAVVLEVRDTA